MGIDLFRIGIAVILLALMFPLVEAIDKYVGSETSFVTFNLWIIGVLLLFISAFVPGARCSGGDRVRDA